MTQLNINDAIGAAVAAAEAETDAAIEQVGNGADARFLIEARAVLESIARKQQELTTDDVADLCKLTPAEPRVWGWVMVNAAKDGIVVGTDVTRKSTKRSCHRRPKKVWKSLVFQTN